MFDVGALSNHSQEDTDWFAHNVGYSLIGMGGVGIVFNTVCLIYFITLKIDTAYSVFSRIAFINLAVSDLLLSLSAATIRGPGFVNPALIYGSEVVNKPDGSGYSKWCEAAALITWFISDLSLLGAIPLSFMFVLLHAPALSLTKLNVLICILSCWCIPGLESVFMVTAIAEKKLTVQYEDEYRRCTFRGDYERYLDKLDSSVFFAIPLGIHIISWGLIVFYVCRHGNNYHDKQWWKFLKTGLTVVLSVTVTWLPYFVTVVWQTLEPSGWFTFVYCFLYTSVIINPLVYGMRSMQFNGKTLGDIVREVFGDLRARALSLPRDPAQEVNQPYSSFDDIVEDAEDMNTIG